MKKLFYLTFLLPLSFAWGQNQGLKSTDTIKSWQLHIGSHTSHFNEVQTDGQGTLGKFDFNPTIGGGLVIPLSTNWQFTPELSWVLPEFGSDSKIIKNTFLFRADFSYLVNDWFKLRLGTSFALLNQHGRGGKAELGNGNETAEFYYPDENRSSINNTFDIGTEFSFGKWAIRPQAYIYQIFKSESRQISYSLLLTRYWDYK